jgi:hypothetical protein
MTERIGPGAVVTLRGTPHLWIADEQGTLHWAGDTRALAGRAVDWGTKRDVGATELRALRRGDPWLSAGLVKIGDPIYFVKWETGEARPTLLHIRGIADLELFGIDATNYGAFVLEPAAWEQRYGMGVAGLPRGELAAALAPGSFRSTPLPIGASAAVGEGWTLTVLSATPNATADVLARNRFNSPPQAGKQFFIVRVSLKNEGSQPQNLFRAGQFRLLGDANVAYRTFDPTCGVIPDPISTTDVFPGGTITGNLCWQVPSTEVGSLVLYHEYFFAGSGNEVRTFFALR